MPMLKGITIFFSALQFPASATDYIQCREMKKALAYVEVDSIQFAEERFRDSLKGLGMDDDCGNGYGREYSRFNNWKEFRSCQTAWIKTRYKLQGFDWRGNPIYNPASALQFKKSKKIRLDMQKEGCP
jgi:hypothetical protein